MANSDSMAVADGRDIPVAESEATHTEELGKGFQIIGEVRSDNARMVCTDINVYYGDKHAIKDVSLDVGKNEVVAMIGPSGCGKSTFLRCLNRMNDVIDSCRIEGEILLDGPLS